MNASSPLFVCRPALSSRLFHSSPAALVLRRKKRGKTNKGPVKKIRMSQKGLFTICVLSLMFADFEDLAAPILDRRYRLETEYLPGLLDTETSLVLTKNGENVFPLPLLCIPRDLT